MGTKILVEEIAENTWFTGGLLTNYELAVERQAELHLQQQRLTQEQEALSKH